MKKRFILCLALLLLAASLLCSCTQGLPLSELYFAAKDATTNYTTQLALLQQGSKLIAANGISEYEIVYNRASTKALRNAIDAFAGRIKQQTGADLLDSKREGVSKRIVIGFPEKDGATPNPCAAQFYIGFSGDDLIIQAHNEIMLISALTHFTQTYLGNGEDDLRLSPDLSYLSPVASYRSREHALIRAEQSGETASQAAQALCDTIMEVASVRLTLKSDFNTSGGITDILFGYPNDRYAQSILETLSYDDFYIGVHDQRLMILAQNDLALSKATDFFLSAFVTAENAEFDREEKVISLPAVCDYYYRGNAILLAEEGVNHTVLIYPENADALTISTAQRFARTYRQWTNTELPIYRDCDYPQGNDHFEILIGDTNRALPNQAYLDSLPNGQWMISVVPEANALSVFAKGEIALLSAMNELGKAIAAQTAAISKTAIEYNTPATDRTLYITEEFSLNGLEPPDFPVSYSYTIFNSFYRLISRAQVSQNAWYYYNHRLERSGFIYQSQEQKNNIVTVKYLSETRAVTLIYDRENKSLELRVSIPERS